MTMGRHEVLVMKTAGDHVVFAVVRHMPRCTRRTVCLYLRKAITFDHAVDERGAFENWWFRPQPAELVDEMRVGTVWSLAGNGQAYSVYGCRVGERYDCARRQTRLKRSLS